MNDSRNKQQKAGPPESEDQGGQAIPVEVHIEDGPDEAAGEAGQNVNGASGEEGERETENGSAAQEEGDQEAPAKVDPADRIAELENKLLRLGAEFDNFKKRAERDKSEMAKYGTDQVLRAILPTLDNLDRALEHSKDGKDIMGIYEGIRITLEELLRGLERFGLKGIEAVGQSFDPTLHEAIALVDSDAHEGNEVVSEMQKGYTLHGRLLRPTQVVIAKGPPEQEDRKEEAGEEERNSGT